MPGGNNHSQQRWKWNKYVTKDVISTTHPPWDVAADSAAPATPPATLTRHAQCQLQHANSSMQRCYRPLCRSVTRRLSKAAQHIRLQRAVLDGSIGGVSAAAASIEAACGGVVCLEVSAGVTGCSATWGSSSPTSSTTNTQHKQKQLTCHHASQTHTSLCRKFVNSRLGAPPFSQALGRATSARICAHNLRSKEAHKL